MEGESQVSLRAGCQYYTGASGYGKVRWGVSYARLGQLNVCQTSSCVVDATRVYVSCKTENCLERETAVAFPLDRCEIRYCSDSEAEIEDVHGAERSGEGCDRRVVYRWGGWRCKRFVPRTQAPGNDPDCHVSGSVEYAALEMKGFGLSAIAESQNLASGDDVSCDTQDSGRHGGYARHLSDELGHSDAGNVGLPVSCDRILRPVSSLHTRNIGY